MNEHGIGVVGVTTTGDVGVLGDGASCFEHEASCSNMPKETMNFFIINYLNYPLGYTNID